MSATTFGHQGIEAVQNKDWKTAVSLLDKALQSSNAPGWLLARAQAHQQLKNYEDALRDAELAYHVAAERGSGNSRKQMIEAQYRRSILYHKLGRYADADCCAKWSMLLAEGRPVGEDDGVEKRVDDKGNYVVTYNEGVADNKGQPGQPAAGTSLENRVFGLMNAQSAGTAKTGFESDWKRAYTWRSQVLGRLNSLPEDDPGRKVSVTKVPPRPQPKSETKPNPEQPESSSDVDDQKKPAKPAEPAPGSVPDEQLKLRVDFYQSSQNVSVSLYVKDVKKEDLSVKLFKNKVEISPLPRPVAPYVKPGDREATSTLILGGDIDPTKSRWSVTPRKVELVLQKATPGIKWGTWGSEEIGSVSSADAGDKPLATSLSEMTVDKTSAPTAPVPAPTAAPSSTAAGVPAYPTSSRSGPKNWDRLGDAEGDDDPQDVNYFFKQLYKGATPEQQRAMMKSFIESNGTALSTDWDDVKSRKVETVPPEGVEAKKWEA